MSPEIDCPGWAPGLNIPDGECVHCGVQKSEHPKHLRSRASGAVSPISGREYMLADSPVADHPEVISPAASARKTPPNVVFCRQCNQGMVISNVTQGSQPEADYACPACGSTGPKSLTPTGAPRGAEVRKPQHQKTPTQIAFQDGLLGVDPRSPGDKAYMEWYGEGKIRRQADPDSANGAQSDDRENILDAEIEDVTPPIPQETVTYADGSSATGPAPLPRVSPEGARAIKVEVLDPIIEAQKTPGDPAQAQEAK